MTLNYTDSAVINTPVNYIQRVKYIPLEIRAINLKVSTVYNVYYNGNKVNDFCKGYGQNLGAPLVSGTNGQLTFMFLMVIPYNQTYLVNNNPSASDPNAQLSEITATLELEAPDGSRSTNYIPILLKM